VSERVFFTRLLNPTTQLRVSVQTWQGRPALDIRKYWLKPGEDSFSATKLGVKVYQEDLPAFVAALIEAAREVDQLEKGKGSEDPADNRGGRQAQ
jgi:hypothetical protein